jgi:hypothetical protein
MLLKPKDGTEGAGEENAFNNSKDDAMFGKGSMS